MHLFIYNIIKNLELKIQIKLEVFVIILNIIKKAFSNEGLALKP